jgi:hypothetical protein
MFENMSFGTAEILEFSPGGAAIGAKVVPDVSLNSAEYIRLLPSRLVMSNGKLAPHEDANIIRLVNHLN